ncbi:MAG TPA: glycosyltransferase family 4 protein [Noviherbaspirillum sp.]|uniref:glycosyltransferase family 4 protein n=1 Tax=Noviherbaspirillum sp. TaxID=1926288 RepID=UPI002B49CF82|nr:glycosyltransferase family 4 protein [Noviherbaspirillum sp.]HJV86991.1 glycosyltransferase family 4 protein [Noviherbaspirillum sp.]
MTRLAILTNEPPPYRIPVFNRVARMPGFTVQVIFCAKREPNRQWDLPPCEFDHVFLRDRIKTVNGRYIHNNPDVIPALQRFAPDLLVLDGLNPTHLYAFFYAWLKGIPRIPLTDGTYLSEQNLSRVHKLVRKIVYSHSAAYLSASLGGRTLYESYGVPADHCFRSHLCTDNDAFMKTAEPTEKKFDLIFCGRMVPEKGPLFALHVARETARRLGRKVNMLVVGSGSEEDRLKTAAAQQTDLVGCHFHGFALQRELPALYKSARIFLFPTHADVWGVVANEACAAGLPVIVTPHAGVAGELVLDGENGFVCELDADMWAERAARLLAQEELREKFSRRSLDLVREYSFDNAAAGLIDACRFALAAVEDSKARRPV